MRRFVVVLGSLVMALAASAQEAPPIETTQLATVVVSGVQPGPGLWKVTSPEGHVLWLLGTLSPLPKHMQWQSAQVEARVARAQAVLGSPAFRVSMKGGFFAQLGLLPALIGVRNNPDGGKLADVVPADLYARWAVLRQRYVGSGGKLEKWRPMFAAVELYEAALRRTGLDPEPGVGIVVQRAAKRAGIAMTPVEVTMQIDDPKVAIAQFKHAALNDRDCFRGTLDRIESDLGAMAQRANAWATGDIAALRQMTYADQMTACREAISESALMRQRGFGDLEQRLQHTWLDAARKALNEHATSVGMLPVARLVARDGWLTQLAAEGYKVQAPDDAATGTAAATAPTQ
jgi:uncharacterized protein YbaP (TraB family)